MVLISAHLCVNERLIAKVENLFLKKLLSSENILLPCTNRSRNAHAINTTTFVFLCLLAERHCNPSDFENALNVVKNKFQNLPLWPDFTPSKGKKKYRLNWTSREIHTEVFSEFFQILQFPEINGGYWIVDQTIQKQNLQRIIQSIKDLLIQIFSKKVPLYFSCPWPNGKPSALSVRFDVDRPISAERAQFLCNLQMKTGLGSFGSWYFRQELEKTSRNIIPILRKRLQEIGTHISNTTQIEADLGLLVTVGSDRNIGSLTNEDLLGP